MRALQPASQPASPIDNAAIVVMLELLRAALGDELCDNGLSLAIGSVEDSLRGIASLSCGFTPR